MILDKAHGVAGIEEMGQHQHSYRRMQIANCHGSHQAFVGVRRRHFDVDQGDIRTVEGDRHQQPVRVRDRGHHLDADLGQQAGQPFPQQHLVVGDHDPHGNTAVIEVSPRSRSTRSVPPRAPTRSCNRTRSVGGESVSTSTVRS